LLSVNRADAFITQILNKGTMKALSVKQPWANLIATGIKTIETRTWATRYRGDLLIVSSRSPKIEPAGCAIAIIRIVDCRPMVKEDETAAGCRLYSGAYAWILSDVRAIEPFPVKGKLGIYNVRVDKRRYARLGKGEKGSDTVLRCTSTLDKKQGV